MDIYPENSLFGDRPATFYLYCHNSKCELYNQQVVRHGILEQDTGWGEVDNPMCNACDSELYSWEDDT